MSYTLSAFIAEDEPLRRGASALDGARVVTLDWRFSLLPLTEELQEVWRRPDEESFVEAFDAFYDLPYGALEWILATSHQTPLAYLEIDLFGGVGSRAAAVWHNGVALLEPSREKSPLPTLQNSVTNRALQLLGVRANSKRDEFDVLGLGRHRHTARWY